MDSIEGATKLLEVGPFLGLRTKPALFYNDAHFATTSSGFGYDEASGGLMSVKGRTNIGSLGAGRSIRGYGRFYTTANKNLFALDDGTLKQSVDSPFSLANISLPFTWTAADPTELELWGNSLMFMANGQNRLVKIDSAMAATRAGNLAPTASPNYGAGAAGVLLGAYQYRCTFQSATAESSGGSIGQAISITNAKMDLTAIPQPVAAEPHITLINIYRTGGTRSTWNYVGQVAVGVTTFTDNVADTAVGQELVLTRDIPPNAYCLTVHQGRLWLGRTDADPDVVWPSEYLKPESFDQSGANYPMRGKGGGDKIRRLLSNGSVLIGVLNRSTWGIFGDRTTNYLVRHLYAKGTQAPGSVVLTPSQIFMLSDDGIRTMDVNGNNNVISVPIDPSLEAYTTAQRAAAWGELQNGVYYLSIPAASKTFFYSSKTGQFGALPWAYARIYYLANDANDWYNMIGIGRNGDTTKLDQWFQTTNDLGANFATTWETDRVLLGGMDTYCYCSFLEIVCDKAAGDFTVTLTFDGDATNKQVSKAITAANGDRQVWSLKDTCQGTDVQIKITATVSTTRPKVLWLGLYGNRDHIFGR